ncbi:MULTISPECIES: hypothetical protein [Haloferax]|uniref:Uncharacterized protein n=2 Tax=Haloferax TaxID=2251 RepID=A0A6G1Z620_9EURY|nr:MULTISPECIES: hypothetical protein [Haloferax]KAB1185529.1 hypothetical protein Hfx1149_15030 [Haloferax sp. CBA1149]MRW82009.1 hypothetical protein [Haloferax marinisediminis]
MTSSGLLVFGDRERVFDDVPPPYQHAVRRVREQFDRDAFHDAVDDPAAFVFFGVAPCNVGVDYDWGRTPAFLGRSIWNETTERFLPIDRAEQVFERLGLPPLNTFQKEVNVRDFHPDRYAIPDSLWYDGPAAGVIVENRRGGSAVVENATVAEHSAREPIRGDPKSVANTVVTDTRLERAIDAVEGRGKPVTTDEVQARVFEMCACEEYDRLDDNRFDWDGLRSAIGSLVGVRLGERADT